VVHAPDACSSCDDVAFALGDSEMTSTLETLYILPRIFYRTKDTQYEINKNTEETRAWLEKR
jgi:hypothetical protein